MDLNPHDYLSWLSFREVRLLVACRPLAGFPTAASNLHVAGEREQPLAKGFLGERRWHSTIAASEIWVKIPIDPTMPVILEAALLGFWQLLGRPALRSSNL